MQVQLFVYGIKYYRQRTLKLIVIIEIVSTQMLKVRLLGKLLNICVLKLCEHDCDTFVEQAYIIQSNSFVVK
jgi:hypothetical protein